MGRSRYRIYEPTHPHFVTCTVLNWLPIFTRKESVEILLDSLKHLQKEENLKLYAYVVLENHIHLVVQSNDVGKSMRHFKSFTAKALLKLLQKEGAETLLKGTSNNPPQTPPFSLCVDLKKQNTKSLQ